MILTLMTYSIVLRKKQLVQPRQISMYLIRKELNGSYPYIGEKLGGRDHTTVMYACKNK